MVDLKSDPQPTPKKTKHGLTIAAVKNWLMPEKKSQEATTFRNRVPENFLRSFRRRSLRVKRTKSLVLPEKRKSDSFVNSQEWTLSRSVPDLRLGIVGSLSSGKSALVHRYLTGSYMQEESPEGGRFKKEILVDNQSYLLLIRDEGGPPELQFTAWVDAVIFVFSLENESSFNAIYQYYSKMSHYRNATEIPVILVGTQDGISESNPRVIDDNRARKLANDLKKCPYYETCATYGLNVERVFQDACQKIVQQRLSTPGGISLTPTNSRPSTPNHFYQQGPMTAPRQHHQMSQQNSTNGFCQRESPSSGGNHMSSPSHHNNHTLSHKDSMSLGQLNSSRQVHTLSSSSHHLHRQQSEKEAIIFRNNDDVKWNSSSSTLGSHGSNSQLVENNNLAKFAVPHPVDNQLLQIQPQSKEKDKDLPTPSSTPTTSRKNRRRSNIFTAKKGDDKLKNGGDIGSGRAIPLKQGYLYKRSNKPLNKEWKKKYVTLCDDGRLTYHPSLHDYMDDVHGKEISLQYVTVKVPGQKPRGSKSIITVAGSNGITTNNTINDGIGGLSLSSSSSSAGKDHRRNVAGTVTEKVLLTAFDVVKEPGSKHATHGSGDDAMVLSSSNSFLNGDGGGGKSETPNVKKRHRRMKSSGVKNSEYDDSDVYEFYIVSLDNKQWHFEAPNSDERDGWVAAIEQQILNSLQLNESSKARKLNNPGEAFTIQRIRSGVPGNDACVDCDAPNPDWASLNLGVLMCIECSGIHRNLGSHISRVRSLDLDDWSPGQLSVMLAIGNNTANSVYESRIQNHTKPTKTSSHEEKERWIRAKYENKEFLPLISSNSSMPLEQQLIDSVCSSNIRQIILVLAQATIEQVNTTVNGGKDLRTALHLACMLGNLAVVQLLIWHNANVKAQDEEGKTCLWYAKAGLSKHGGSGDWKNLVDLLVSYGCPESGANNSSGTLPRRRGSQTSVI